MIHNSRIHEGTVGIEVALLETVYKDTGRRRNDLDVWVVYAVGCQRYIYLAGIFTVQRIFADVDFA